MKPSIFLKKTARSVLATLAIMFIFGLTLSITSCSKQEQDSPITETKLNDAERFVQETDDTWNGSVSIEFFNQYVASQDLFPEYILRECLKPGEQLDTSLNARTKRLETLNNYLINRDDAGQAVESIIQVSPTKRIIDANPESVALVIANMGSTVPAYTSYDYLTNSLNRITTSDLHLANWAYQNSNVPGNFFAVDDDYIELVDGTVTISTMFSGQNYSVEALLLYNGPNTNFTFFNTYTGTTETITITTGEMLSYGPGTPLGELILDPTLYNENWDGEILTEFVDARIVGPIPGGSWFALQSGSINQFQ